MAKPNPTNKFSRIRDLISRTFNKEELNKLTFDLNVDIEEFEGGKSTVVQALVEHLEHRGLMAALIDYLKDNRPKEDWDSYLLAEPDAPSPYKGLQYYTEADEDNFFGREHLTKQLVQRLTKQRFLVIVGASGCGKSSLVRAGLIPAVRRGEVERNGRSSREWPIHLLTPGDQPLKSLAVCLYPEIESIGRAKELTSQLLEDSDTLDYVLMQQTAERPGAGLLLVIDHFEELFTQCDQPEMRKRFIDNMANAVTSSKQGPLTLVLSIRADFYTHAVQYESLRPLLETGQQIVGAMNRDELRSAIEQPAVRGGWELQGGLVETILDDVSDEPGALPLLSHALQETWLLREGNELTLASYQAAGRVQGAIATTAETVYGKLTPDKQRLARRIFLRLTELGEGTEDTRRRVLQSELVRRPDEQQTVSDLLQLLANARLITTGLIKDRNGRFQAVVEVAHEVLIRQWPDLRGWLDENRDWLRLQRQICRNTTEWIASGRDPSLLYRGARLVQAREQAAEHRDDLNEIELEFINTAIEEKERREAEIEAQRQRELQAAQELAQARQAELLAQQGRTAIVRRAVISLSILTSIAIITTLFAMRSSVDANRKAIEAEQAQGTAEAEAIRADKSAATAIFNEELAATRETEAIIQSNLAQSQKLAGSALTVSDQEPMQSLLLAITAGQTGETALAMEALNQQIPKISDLAFTFHHEGEINGAIWNRNNTRILSWSDDNTVRVWEPGNSDNLLLLRHDNWVNGAQWNEDESQILSWSADGIVRIWDVVSGRPLRTFLHNGEVTGAVWNKNGTRILSWSKDRTARVWSVTTGVQLIKLEHGGWVNGAQWNKDESQILSWDIDGSVRLWNANFGRLLLTLHHINSVSNAQWNQDEDQILSWGLDRTIRVWDSTTGRELISLAHDNKIIGVDWNPDNLSILSWSLDKTVRAWSLFAESPIFIQTHEEIVRGARWNKDNRFIMSWSSDGVVRVWDKISGENTLTLNHGGTISDANWDIDEKRILSWNEEGIGRVWDAITGEPLLILPDEQSLLGMTWDKNDNNILSWGKDGLLKIWDANPNTPRLVLDKDYLVENALWNNEGNRILIWSRDGTVQVWNITSLQLEHNLIHDGAVNGAIWNEDESRILSWSDDGTVRIWDNNSGQRLLTLQNMGAVTGAKWNKDETLILSWNINGTIRIWDAGTGEENQTISAIGSVNEAWWNFNESRILGLQCNTITDLSACRYSTVRVWNSETSLPILLLDTPLTINGARWNKIGTRILTWGEDRTIRIWNADSGDNLLTLYHDNGVLGAIWDQDESRILSWSKDKTARIWDAVTGEQLVRLNHESQVLDAIWNKDESRIISRSNDEFLRIWDPNLVTPILKLSHARTVLGFRFDKNENRILSWSLDGTARVWSANTGEWLLTLGGDGKPIINASWNSDESRILLVSKSGLMSIYHTSTKELANLACQYTTRNFTWDEWQLYFPGQPYERTCDQWPAHPSVPESALE